MKEQPEWLPIIGADDSEKYEKSNAMSWLLSELEKGRISGEQEGWLPAEEVFSDLEARCRG